MLINVGGRTHQWAENQFRVVLNIIKYFYALLLAYIEEVDLQCPVAQVQHNGRLGAEPGVQAGQPRNLVTLANWNVGARLDQMLIHVGSEVFEQRYLLLQSRRIFVSSVVMLHVVALSVLELAE